MKKIDMKKVIFLTLAVFVLFGPVPAYCLSATAQVDRNRISENESISFKVAIEGGEGTVDTSAITDFRVLPRGTGTSVSIVNGTFSKTMTCNYLLVPLKQGRLTIPALTVSSGTEQTETKPVIITVSTASNEKKHERDVFATAELSGTDVYLGQQCIYTFRLYTAISIADARLQQPSFKGFLAKEANNRKNFRKTINARAYDVTQINYVLIPELSGSFEIEPAVVMCQIPVSGRADPFFGNRLFSMGRTKTLRVAADSIQGTVKSLPLHQGEKPFSGLVGTFDIKAELDRNSMTTGDSVTLTIKVSGTGNIMDASMPEVVVPEEFKVYDDTPEETINLTSLGYAGEKIFKQALVPVNPGSYQLGPVFLSYFDVQQQQYEIVSTPPLILDVQESETGGDKIAAFHPGTFKDGKMVKTEVEFTGHDILALKEGAQVLITRTGMPFNFFVTLLALPCLFFFLFKAVMRFGHREESPGEAMAKKAGNSLQMARNHNLSQEEFLKHLHSALISKLLAAGRSSGESLTEDEARDILVSAGHQETLVSDVTTMLHEIDQARFSGGASGAQMRKELLGKVKKVFKTLGAVLFCFGIMAAMPANSRADDSGTLFLEGVNSYKNGDFSTAAQRFEQVAQNGVKSGQLYYNIGNSYLKAGDIGRAILWYERSIKLIPLDPDLKFNLDYARGFVKDKPDEEGIRVSDLVFVWMDYIPSRNLQFGALVLCAGFFLSAGYRIYRKKRIFTLAGVLFFSLFMISASAALYDYYRQQSDSFAVIVQDQSSVRSGFSEDSTELFVLHAGTRVKVERSNDQYFRIFFSPGKIGWINRKDARII